jgi:hypothetical protein
VIDGVDERRRGRRWPVWLPIALILAALAGSLPVVLAMTVLDRLSAGASGAGSSNPARSPGPGDPPSVVGVWIAERVDTLLQQQAGALLRGDEAGFLAVADPTAPAVADLKRQFKALRAMRVAVWRPSVGTPARIERNGAIQWRLSVTYQHCFVAPDCRPGPVVIETRWVDGGGGPRLVAIDASAPGEDGPRPWEVSELVVQLGERTLVATTPALRAHLPELVTQADRAAAVADRFAIDGSKPERYHVFYAGAAEWQRWYGGDLPVWTAGFALPVGDQFDVVLNAQNLESNFIDDLLRHEMTHAASLSGDVATDTSTWWLVEGVAEYAAAGAGPVSRYDSLPDVRRLLRKGGWTGQLETTEPGRGAADWEVGAGYGVGYLAVRHLVDRFGERQMLAFFKAVVHDRQEVTDASMRAFGVPWTLLHDECASYVRSSAG